MDAESPGRARATRYSPWSLSPPLNDGPWSTQPSSSQWSPHFSSDSHQGDTATPAISPDMPGPSSPPASFTFTPMQRMPPRKPVRSPNASTYTFETDASNSRLLKRPYGLGRAETSPEIRHHRPRTGWLISNWNPLWAMYGFFLLGVLGAIGHHAFYQSLAGREASNQLQMLRYGTVLAYFTKACLAGSIIIAYRQRLWLTMRSKTLYVSTIDGLFEVIEDLSALFRLEIWTRAKVAGLMALFVWLVPLGAILSPATLTAEVTTHWNTTLCPRITTLNFSAEMDHDWRDPVSKSYAIAYSLQFWNTTDPDLTDKSIASGEFDYYDQPSDLSKLFAGLGAYQQKPIVRSNAAMQICGVGWNCSYMISFVGPGYQCTEHSQSDLSNLNAPFSFNDILPQGNASYLSSNLLGEYFRPQVNASAGGVPTSKPYPDHLGAFRVEPLIWTGYAVSNNQSHPQTYNAHIFSCEHWVTNYTINMTFANDQQNANVTERDFLHPIIDTTYIPDLNASDGTFDNTVADPTSNYVLPSGQDALPNYRLVASYHTMGLILRTWLQGNIQIGNGSLAFTHTQASQTKLVDPSSNFFPVQDLMDQTQSFYEDILLSLLAYEPFLVVVNATTTDPTAGHLGNADGSGYPCIKSRLLNTYVYHVRDLWLSYSAIILMAIVCLVLGVRSISANENRVLDMRFSTIVASTRGPALEELDWRKWGDCGYVPREEAERVRLGYGIINDSVMDSTSPILRHWRSRSDGESTFSRGGEEYCGFGLEGKVRQITNNPGGWEAFKSGWTRRGSVLF